MSSSSKIDISPPIHRLLDDSKSFDRGVFRKVVSVLAAPVPASQTASVLRAEPMRKTILNLPKIRSVMSHDGEAMSDERLVLLRVSTQDDLTSDARHFLEEKDIRLRNYDLVLEYDYWTADEILQAILPESLCDGSPTGFSITGHLAHLNLNDEYLPYKHVIGQVILDKNKRIRTVVNKLNTIHNQFRFFDMELIAGDPDYIVEHYESDCRFTFDFTKVYWNSRLHTEHERLVRFFEPADGIVADVFAGVGPFALPAAKKGCAVLANDLNPESVKWLQKNVDANQVTNTVRVTCVDGRKFIRSVVREALDNPFPPFAGFTYSRRQSKEERRRRQEMQKEADRSGKRYALDISPPPLAPPPSYSPRNRISHFVMNLPDSAIEFLDAFRGILSPINTGLSLNDVYQELPMIHCHCFTRCLDPEEADADIKQRVRSSLGHAVEKDVSIHFVRSVAPNKDMYCISFRLPGQVAFGVGYNDFP